MVNTAKPKLISQHTISRPTDRTLVCFSESILVTVFEINGQIYQARVIPGRVGIGTCAGNVHGRVFLLERAWRPLNSFSRCRSATLEIIWPSQYSLAGAEMEIDLHMLRLERGWGCAFCGYQSASTAAKVDVRRHIRRQHFGLTGR